MEWLGWVGRVLEGHRAMGWLGWKGPGRSQSCGMNHIDHRMMGGWVGRVLEDHRSMEWLGWKGPQRS